MLFSSELYFSDLTYTDIYVDGQIDGVRNLSLGQGVNFVIGENVSYITIIVILNTTRYFSISHWQIFIPFKGYAKLINKAV